MSIPFSNTHYRIPQGFGNLLEGLTREILREQPENIPAFAAAYFENLLEKREKTNFDPAEWGAKVEDRFYNNHAFKEQEQSAQEKSQTSVKGEDIEDIPGNAEELEEEEKEKEESAAVKIQAAFRGHVAREEFNLKENVIIHFLLNLQILSKRIKREIRYEEKGKGRKDTRHQLEGAAYRMDMQRITANTARMWACWKTSDFP
ncbi:sperm surface protein Sp17 isoform X1 [Ictidomys tridecemlineatus]|uniref:sperm surface protein Sp17 isoform X1 n=1 Tax=Ictidomys tridecemlineatus TaxID=43179 RepID=UPI001A9FE6AE|nr:sperm surface protein Sp17 isoform X1 [Ictidomys tridecemlineatus]XP_040141380.1 sperm surface protein Sp17 isoform X1 [Ictidomys tridecemlineatus]XP_040141381.1 sperm surface protein Sp17 isoform X1 [Ictidomys tridecemlineatus]